MAIKKLKTSNSYDRFSETVKQKSATALPLPVTPREASTAAAVESLPKSSKKLIKHSTTTVSDVVSNISTMLPTAEISSTPRSLGTGVSNIVEVELEIDIVSLLKDGVTAIEFQLVSYVGSATLKASRKKVQPSSFNKSVLRSVRSKPLEPSVYASKKISLTDYLPADSKKIMSGAQKLFKNISYETRKARAPRVKRKDLVNPKLHSTRATQGDGTFESLIGDATGDTSPKHATDRVFRSLKKDPASLITPDFPVSGPIDQHQSTISTTKKNVINQDKFSLRYLATLEKTGDPAFSNVEPVVHESNMATIVVDLPSSSTTGEANLRTIFLKNGEPCHEVTKVITIANEAIDTHPNGPIGFSVVKKNDTQRAVTIMKSGTNITGCVLYKKIVKNNDITTGNWRKVTELEFDNNENEIYYIDEMIQDYTTIYRVLPKIGSQIFYDFKSSTVTGRVKNRDNVALVGWSNGSVNYIKISSSVDNILEIDIFREDLVTKEKKLIRRVGASKLSTLFEDRDISEGRSYRYSGVAHTAYSYYEFSDDVVIDTPFIVDLNNPNLSVEKLKGGISPKFKVEVSLADTEVDDYKKLLKSQGSYQEFFKDIEAERQNFKDLLKYSVRVHNATSGESIDLGTFTKEIFEPSAVSNLKITPGSTYYFEFNLCFLDIRNVLNDTLVLEDELTKRKYYRDPKKVAKRIGNFLETLPSQARLKNPELKSKLSSNNDFLDNRTHINTIIHLAIPKKTPGQLISLQAKKTTLSNILTWRHKATPNADHYCVYASYAGVTSPIASLHCDSSKSVIYTYEDLEMPQYPGTIAYTVELKDSSGVMISQSASTQVTQSKVSPVKKTSALQAKIKGKNIKVFSNDTLIKKPKRLGER